MATEKRIECMKEEKEVAGEQSNIEKLAIYIGKKKNAKHITSAIRGLIPKIGVQKINQAQAKF